MIGKRLGNIFIGLDFLQILIEIIIIDLLSVKCIFFVLIHFIPWSWVCLIKGLSNKVHLIVCQTCIIITTLEIVDTDYLKVDEMDMDRMIYTHGVDDVPIFSCTDHWFLTAAYMEVLTAINREKEAKIFINYQGSHASDSYFIFRN